MHDLQVDQALEPVGQEVAGDSEVLVEAFEAAYPAEEVPEDEQGPTVADRRQGGCDGTAVGGGVVGDGRSVAVSCEMKRTSPGSPGQAVRTRWSEGGGLRSQVGQQVVEGGHERGHALVLEDTGDFGQVDADVGYRP